MSFALESNQDTTRHCPVQLTCMRQWSREPEKALSKKTDRNVTRAVKCMKVENDPYSPQSYFKLSKYTSKITSIDLYFQG